MTSFEALTSLLDRLLGALERLGILAAELTIDPEQSASGQSHQVQAEPLLEKTTSGVVGSSPVKAPSTVASSSTPVGPRPKGDKTQSTLDGFLSKGTGSLTKRPQSAQVSNTPSKPGDKKLAVPDNSSGTMGGGIHQE